VIKKLTRHGNSLALVIDRSILDLLNINVETPLSIKTDGFRLFVSPALNDPDNERVLPDPPKHRRRDGRRR
jgi:antitoxin component of MazEF toxin-antitoxin module